MEDRFKLLRVEYLGNNPMDLPQILNLSSGGQTKTNLLVKKTTINERLPQNIKR